MRLNQRVYKYQRIRVLSLSFPGLCAFVRCVLRVVEALVLLRRNSIVGSRFQKVGLYRSTC